MRYKPEENRNSIEIKCWLLRNGLDAANISRDVGVTRTVVSWTINRKVNNKKVLRWLLEKGCPAELLGLPLNMLFEANNPTEIAVR